MSSKLVNWGSGKKMVFLKKMVYCICVFSQANDNSVLIQFFFTVDRASSVTYLEVPST